MGQKRGAERGGIFAGSEIRSKLIGGKYCVEGVGGGGMTGGRACVEGVGGNICEEGVRGSVEGGSGGGTITGGRGVGWSICVEGVNVEGVCVEGTGDLVWVVGAGA